MKKIISAFLCVCMIFAVFTATLPVSSAVTHGYLLGDANDDIDVTSKDVLLVRKYVAGVISEKELDMTASDVNFDNDVTLKDVLKIRKVVAGLEKLDANNTDKLYRVSSVTLSGRNIGRYTVVIPANDERMSYAARELVKYIKKECGVSLNTVYDSSEVKGYAIRYIYDSADEYNIGKEGYSIRFDSNGDLLIYCGSLRGPLYATYFILEELGWRFLLAKEDWNFDDYCYLYEADNMDIASGFNVTDEPFFAYRAIGVGGVNSQNFAMLNANAVDSSGSGHATSEKGGGEGALYVHGHSYAYLMAGSEHRYDDNYTRNFEKTQPCLSDEETFNTMYDWATSLIEERKGWGQTFGIDYTQISVSPNDNTDFCQCSICKQIYDDEGSVGGTIFRLANKMAEALDEYCPGIEIFTIAHWEARQPPKMTRPHDNVCVCFRLGGCNNHSFLHTEECDACGGNPRLQDEWGNNLNNSTDTALYEQWSQYTNNLYSWYCSDNLSYYVATSPNLFNIYDDFKYMAQNSTRGIYCEGCGSSYYVFEYLRGYMISKVMWDPFMSEEEYNDLLNEYLMLWYGDGWEYIREYIDLEDASTDEIGCFRNNFDRPWNVYNKEYFRDNYEYLYGLFEKAYGMAETSVQKDRVLLTRAHCDFYGLSATYERDWVNGDAGSRAEYSKRYGELWEAFEKYGIVMTNWEGNNHSGVNFPKNKDDIRDTMSWILDDFSGAWEYIGGRWV